MIRLGGGEDFRIGDGINRGAGHDFGHMHQALMGNAGFTLRRQLPGMARRADGASGPPRLHRGHRPGYIADIGGPHATKALIFQRYNLVAKRQFHLRRQAMATEGGNDILGLQRRLDFARIAAIFIIKLRRAQALEIIIHRLFQRRIAHEIRNRAHHFGADAGFCHQRRAIGDFTHPCDEPVQFHQIPRADQITHLGRALHHIGRNAARIQIGVMNARIGWHMFAHVIHANIHELHRIQGAAAQMRRGGSV